MSLNGVLDNSLRLINTQVGRDKVQWLLDNLIDVQSCSVLPQVLHSCPSIIEG